MYYMMIMTDSIDNLKHYDTHYLRKLLLSINGIGPETADSILLYALNRPIFVVDAYTKRFIKNHGLYNGNLGITMMYSSIS